KLIVFVFPVFSIAQSTVLMEGNKASHFLERLDIKQQSNYDLILSIDNPLERKLVAKVAQEADSLNKLFPGNLSYALSKVDQYNLNSALINNIEWLNGNKDIALS